MDLNRLRLFERLDSCLISSKKKQGCSSQFVGKNFHCTFLSSRDKVATVVIHRYPTCLSVKMYSKVRAKEKAITP